MMESTIYESFTLPSKGLVYEKPINPNITLRTMTTMEEMKRLSPTDMPYKVMSDIIEACMQQAPDIHVYEMCLGDYQFLLHKIRIVTYGSEYKMAIQCPECKEITESIANLENLEVHEWDESLIENKLVTLPVSKVQVELKFQTPRDLDIIAYRAKEMRKKTKQNLDYTVLFTVMSLINTIDGRKLSSIELEEFVKHLPNKDVNFLLNRSMKLNNLIGMSNTIKLNCIACGHEMEVPFRITSEFFGPTD